MRDESTAILELTEVAAGPGPPGRRADDLLAVLRRLVPFDSAWIAHVDALQHSYSTLASRDLDAPTLAYLQGPTMARDIDVTGTNRHQPPLSPSDLPYAAEELRTWSECLLPSGYHEALAVALFEPGGRHVGFLALLSEARQPPPPERRRQLGRLIPALAETVDPMRALLPAARLVQDATSGVVLRADGQTQVLPGLQESELLTATSPVIAVARTELAAERLHTSFLWPLGGTHPPHGHARITVLAASDVPDMLTGMVLLSPPRDLHGLTPRELEILGLLVDGRSNGEISKILVVAQRTVAAHVEHILVKLGAPSRTLAAVRAEREGLYVPHSAMLEGAGSAAAR